MHKVYVLQSIKHKRFYIGHTSNLANRLHMHNSGKVKSTKPYCPYKVIYTEEFASKNDAYRRELQMKRYKGGDAFKNLVNTY